MSQKELIKNRSTGIDIKILWWGLLQYLYGPCLQAFCKLLYDSSTVCDVAASMVNDRSHIPCYVNSLGKQVSDELDDAS